MLRPKWVVGQRGLATIVAPLALGLSMSISHQAMAACTGTPPSPIVCTGDDNENTDDISATGVSATTNGILLNPGSGSEPTGSLTNSGDITVTYTGTGNVHVRGIDTESAGAYTIDNTGNITISSSGRGQAYGIAGNGAVEEIDVTNSGHITVTRTLAAEPAQITSAAINLTNGGSDSLSIAAGFFTEEEPERASFDNLAGGIVEAVGRWAIGVYNRAGDFTLNNEGEIKNDNGRGGGIAIAGVSDAGGEHSFEFTNSGKVSGDIVLVNGAALRWWALSKGLGVGSAPSSPLVGGTGVDDRLIINSQYGQLDTVVTNEHGGNINGDFYYSNGTHELVNHGTIIGNIDVDQRDTSVTTRCTPNAGVDNCYTSVSGLSTGVQSSPSFLAEDFSENAVFNLLQVGTLGTSNSTVFNVTTWGTKDFTLEQDGKLKGDVTILTQDAHTITLPKSGGGTVSFDIPDSVVTLKPHIYGGGGDDSTELVDSASGYIDGTLKIWNGTDTTLEKTTTIDPVIDSLVRTGEWYTVAKHVTAAVGDLPTVEDTVLVHWDVATDGGHMGVSGDSLAIGATVNDAADVVPGLSNPGIATINALMQGGDSEVEALGGALQNLKDEGDVRKAGEQLAPETNFATQQAAFTLNMLTGSYIDNRLNGVGATATPSSAFAAPSGLGMSQTASAAPTGRMSLGLGMNDGRMNIGANDGRMDAGIYDKDPDLRGRGYSAALWGQAFGAGLDQSERQNVDGAQTHIYGGLAGADTWISSDTRLGFAAGYGNTSINGTGDTAQNKTDVDSYFGVIYGAYKGQGWYLSTRASYAWHDYSTTRVLNAGGLSDVATGSHSGNQYSASAEIGSPMHYYGATLTPVASLNWSQLDQDGYSETSGGGMALTIASQETTSLASGLGAKALIPIAADTLLEGRAIWYHEFEDTNQQVTAAFSGGSSFLASGPSVGRDTAAIGVGLFAYAEAGVSFQLNYDALLRQDFVGHTGTGRVKVEF